MQTRSRGGLEKNRNRIEETIKEKKIYNRTIKGSLPKEESV